MATGHVDVDEMLASVPSSTLTKWMGYDLATGQLGQRYITEVLPALYDMLQQVAIITAQDKNARVQPFPRPHELYERAKKGGS